VIKHLKSNTIKTVLIFFVGLVIIPNLVFATNNPVDIIVKSPYQVKPGASLPIIITVTHEGNLPSDFNLTGLSSDVFLQKVSSLEYESQKDTLTPCVIG
jgi:hypothetical protein